jgi:hypothetical protein
MNDPHDNAQADREEALERYRETLTHATTVPQPLAWACAAGHCPVIMSDTRPGMEHEGKLIGIHASKRWSGDDYFDAFRGTLPDVFPPPETLTYGALIGVARLVGVVQAKAGDPIRFWHVSGRSACVGTYASEDVAARIRPWWRSDSKWGLLLTDAVLLPEPIPMRGAGGVWRISGCDDGYGGPPTRDFYDERRYFDAWALEQWRKARGA